MALMNSGISISLLCFSCLSLVALVLVHALICRYGASQRSAVSPQLALVGLALVFNAPVLSGVWLIAWLEGRATTETLYMLLFAFMVFNGVAYAYFHFFNMSETARRIRMLLQIRQTGPSGLRIRELEREYSPREMIETRLDRLMKMHQLVLNADGRYRLSGRVLLWAGRIMAGWRHLVLRRVLGHQE
jgi:hypothetical protein